MRRLPGTDDEAQRLNVLGLYPVDEAASEQLDRIARLAALSCDAPFGLISIVEADRQKFVGKSGLELRENSPRGFVLCPLHDQWRGDDRA